QITGRPAIRAIGSNHCDIGIAEVPSGKRKHRLPAWIQNQFAARKLNDVTVGCIVWNIAFEENNLMPASPEGLAEPSPKCRMPIAPGRTNRQAENNKLHS